MECKVSVGGLVHRLGARFNRDIVECKGIHRRHQWRCCQDLIETLWNVKLKQYSVVFNANKDLIETLWNVKLMIVTVTALIAFGFNRDIVECKVKTDLRGATKSPDLIETLWNVKMNAAGGYYNTYWRFNRDIVECKGRYAFNQQILKQRFNRDIVECKVLPWRHGISAVDRI